MSPTVTATSPVASSPVVTGVLTNSRVSATFSKVMAPASITKTSFTLACPSGTAVAASVALDATGKTATLTPDAVLPANTLCVATVTTAATDNAGFALASNFVWSFMTAAAPQSGGNPGNGVDLGTAAGYGAFGGAAGVTNQGINTVVGGNVGTTAACSLVTGLHDATNVYTQTPLNVGVVNGSIACAPPAPGTATSMAAATQARADALSAYNALAAMPAGTDPGAGQLGGLVLPAAVYTAAGGTFGITSGNLTLDAQGNANAVWVFQSASALTVGLSATPRQVLLINGAQAKNVFWQVGSAARIEDGSAMVGTIIAPAGVTISTAGQALQTTLTGRALGLTASVTMVNTTIVAP